MNERMNEQQGNRLSTADVAAATRERAATQNGVDGAGSEQSHSDVSTAVSETNGSSKAAPLLAMGDAEALRARWREVQTQFVDEPRRCVEQADSLVAEVMQRLAEMFATERSRLEQQWDRGDQVSTEDLRQALQRYRSFFERLLSV